MRGDDKITKMVIKEEKLTRLKLFFFFPPPLSYPARCQCRDAVVEELSLCRIQEGRAVEKRPGVQPTLCCREGDDETCGRYARERTLMEHTEL